MATTGEEFDEYASALTELVLNSKPIINSLTILAGEIAGKDEGRARAVATLIRAHIRGLPPKSKLCGFYLLDSVVKNLRGPFVRCFSEGLSDLFLTAYAKVDATQKKSMVRLFGTWKSVFPSSVLDEIDEYLAPPPAAPAPVPAPAQRQWQAPVVAAQPQWAPPAQQWTGYAAQVPPLVQPQYAQHGGYAQAAAPPPPPALSGAAGGHMLANMLQSGSGGDLSALIASLEAKGASAAGTAPPASVSRAQPGEVPPLTADFDPKKNLGELNVRREAVVRSLYSERPFQCSQTGRRFIDRVALDAHMDWLHARRRRRKEGKVSRKWFVDAAAWLKGLQTMAEDVAASFFGSGGGGDDKAGSVDDTARDDVDESVSVPADESQKTCALSGEPFETFWNEDEQEWHYRGAVVLDRAVGGAKKGSIVLARAVPKKKTTAASGGAAAARRAKGATAAVKTEDGGVRRSGRGAKTKAEDAPGETSPAKRARRGGAN